MEKGLMPFWEEAYQSEDAAAFSVEPNATLKEFEGMFSEAVAYP